MIHFIKYHKIMNITIMITTIARVMSFLSFPMIISVILPRSKFLPYVRSKSDMAQFNEILCKVVCHNASVLVNCVFELDIDLKSLL